MPSAFCETPGDKNCPDVFGNAVLGISVGLILAVVKDLQYMPSAFCETPGGENCTDLFGDELIGDSVG